MIFLRSYSRWFCISVDACIRKSKQRFCELRQNINSPLVGKILKSSYGFPSNVLFGSAIWGSEFCFSQNLKKKMVSRKI